MSLWVWHHLNLGVEHTEDPMISLEQCSHDLLLWRSHEVPSPADQCVCDVLR
jgi:hypothetical protein